MPYTIYKLIHLSGILMVFMSLGGLVLHIGNGGTKESNSWRKQAAITHGVGMVLALLGGFGLLAKLGIHWPWPLWVWGKFLIWIILGGVIGMIYKQPQRAKAIWWGTLLLGILAAKFAIFKLF